MSLPSLADLPPIEQRRGGDPKLLAAEIRHHIDAAIDAHPRSQQVEIGPSEVGTECDRCLGFKLAGVPERRDPAWLPTVGTAVHTWLADAFTEANRGLHPARWLVETRVDIGEIDGRPIVGSSDFYDRVTATVVDWKIVGATTLKAAKAGPSEVYRRQLHLYGRGFVRRGLPVDTVMIAYLPRNAVSLDAAVFWHEAYDETVALEALARADALARALRVAGPETVLPRLAALPGCPSCARYPLPDGSYPTPAGHRPDLMSDLLATA